LSPIRGTPVLACVPDETGGDLWRKGKVF
jgi:hypothetical protein